MIHISIEACDAAEARKTMLELLGNCTKTLTGDEITANLGGPLKDLSELKAQQAQQEAVKAEPKPRSRAKAEPVAPVLPEPTIVPRLELALNDGTFVPAPLDPPQAPVPNSTNYPAPPSAPPAGWPMTPAQFASAQQAAQSTLQGPVAMPTAAAPTYSLEQLAVAATPLVDAGRGPELRNLLTGKYGVSAMTMLSKEYYGAFAMDLRAMGATL